jgi:hypothetical protein
MAIREIKTEKFDILGEPWKGAIKFESKTDLFFMALPKKITETTGASQVSAKTLDELREDFKRAVSEYGELIATSRKIIAFSSRAEIKREEGYVGDKREGFSGIYGQRSSVFEGVLELRFAVGVEATRGGRKQFKDLNGASFDQDLIRYDGTLKHGTHVIEWKAEREAFFRSMIDSIEKAKERMDKLFDHEDDATILQLIDHAGGNLLGFDATTKKEAA